MPQYNNEDMNKKDVRLLCLLPVAPVYVQPSDGNIYKYLPWAFTRVYMQFPAPPHFGKEK